MFDFHSEISNFTSVYKKQIESRKDTSLERYAMSARKLLLGKGNWIMNGREKNVVRKNCCETNQPAGFLNVPIFY
jgi:hypothetical protein